MITTSQTSDANERPWTTIDEARRRIFARRGKPLKILILGAGMAGLAAAYELSKHPDGHTVHVYEGSNRVGGRVMTHFFDATNYHELGAMRIPAPTHDYTLRYIEEMGLATRPFITAHKDGFYEIRGEKFHMDKEGWSKLVTLFPGLLTFEQYIVKSYGPQALLGAYMHPLTERLAADPNLRRLLVQGRLSQDTTGFLRALDAKSVIGYLLDEVHAGRASAAGVALVGAALSGESRWHWSLAVDLRGSLTNGVPQGGRLLEIVDGFERLPRAVCDHIKDKVLLRFGAKITGVDARGDKVRINVREGGADTWLEGYDRVLSTLPFSVLRVLGLAGLSADKMRAIQNMEYASSTKVLLLCKDRFWERYPRPIRGGSSVSDSLARQTYYPSDSARAPTAGPAKASLQGEADGYWSVQTQFDELEEQPLNTADGDAAPTPGVLLGSYSWNNNARQLGMLSGEAMERHVLEDLKKIHEEIGDYYQAAKSIVWDEHPWAKGAFALTPPGDLTDYYEAGLRPEKNLFFAGEHLSIAPGWIQGALESGLRATAEMLEMKG